MTRWCPVCESPALAVARAPGSIDDPGAVTIGRDLPGIEPSHLCSRCPTFFCGRDRFYLTALHDKGVHGIAVWPHGESPLSIEIGGEGMVIGFGDGASVLVPRVDTRHIATNFFRRFTEREISAWASRRGFRLRMVPAGGGTADLVVDRPGPHFALLVTKSWFQSNQIRSTDDVIMVLESVGARPVLFRPTPVEH